MSPHRQKYFKYRGRSMWPFFQEGDLLEIQPITTERLRIGDCILFRDPNEQLVVHRLIDKRKGLRTRGDATKQLDSFVLSPDSIKGQVSWCHRLGKRTKVTGGALGLLIAFLYRYAGRIDPCRSSRGGRVARFIQNCSSTLLKPILARGKTKHLRIQGQGPMVIWVLGNYVIGLWEPVSRQYQVRWPLRIFVKLPSDSG